VSILLYILTTLSILKPQMAQVLVRKNKEMKDRVANARCVNLRQATMTQEFDSVADGAAKLEALPKGWIRIWDNPGGRYYFFNTVDHDIQHDLSLVHAKVALNALNAARAETEEQDQDSEVDVPDAVVSASRNVIISPSPVKSEFTGKKRKSPPVISYGGTVDMSILSSSDEEEDEETKWLRELQESSDSSTDCNSRKPAPVYRNKKGIKQLKVRKKKKIKVTPVASLPRVQYEASDDESNESDKSENLCDSVNTQDLPNTEDFGGANALVTLQTEPVYFNGEEDQEEYEEDGEDDNN
jgi:hypothetical protein